MSGQEHGHLRLVDVSETTGDEGAKDSGQLSFSFEHDALVMVLVDLTNASEAEFRRALDLVRPDVVVDLRMVPRFDFGRLNRLIAFRMFERLSASYHDLLHVLGVKGPQSALQNPVFVAGPLAKILETSPRSSRVLVLLDDAAVLDRSLEIFPQKMPARAKDGGWRVRRLADL